MCDFSSKKSCGIVALAFPAVLAVSALFLIPREACADEVCDEFPDVHTNWTFRLPRCGPTISFEDRPDFLRFFVPDGITANGNFDNWTGVDLAPTFERTDMGSGDWIITTRLEFDVDNQPLAAGYHAGLMFAFGPSSNNDVVYWGEYSGAGVLAVERVGMQIRPTYLADLGPVSLQVEKSGDDYFFRHRSDDGGDWVEDLVSTAETGEMASTEPVTRVGLIVKTYGAGPQVAADFDYFCLDVPGVTLPTVPVTTPIPVKSPLGSLTCERLPSGNIALSWATCPDGGSETTVMLNGETVRTLPATETSVTLTPPFPGGSIIHVEVDNGFNRPASCTLSKALVDICDDFEEDPLASGEWNFRTPQMVPEGPTLSVDDNPGFLRFFVPSSATAGNHFDNWVGVDLAPSLERYDMGDRDFTISTRLEWPEELGPPVGNHHVGLMVAYGSGAPDDAFNDVTYWGEYLNATTLRVERTGGALTAMLPYEGAPVSLQIQKSGNSLTFSHRQDDGDPWISDATYPIQLPFAANAAGSPPAGTPVTRVGLLIKTWGASPDVTADFDYFCLQVLDSPPEAAITATPSSGTVPIDVVLSAEGSADPSGGTLTYKWDFGDGQTGEGATVTHRYTTAGLVTVTLTATDDEKNVGTATTQLYLSEDVSPLTFSRLGSQSKNGLVRIDRAEPESPYCLHVGGSQLAFSADQAYFLQKQVNGNFVVTAKITDATLANARTRAGLMARLNTDENSANVFMGIDSADDGYVLQTRATTPGTTRRFGDPIAPPRGPVPAWVRLERQGGTFIGSYSNDGTTFVEYARQDVPALDVAGLLVGFAATSGLDTTTFDYCAVLNFGDEVPGEVFHRGDADDNGSLQLTDALRVLGFLFLGGPPPTCLDAGDADDNGALQLTDALRVLGFLFLGGPPPSPPGPPGEACGVDPTTEDELDCASYTNC